MMEGKGLYIHSLFTSHFDYNTFLFYRILDYTIIVIEQGFSTLFFPELELDIRKTNRLYPVKTIGTELTFITSFPNKIPATIEEFYIIKVLQFFLSAHPRMLHKPILYIPHFP